MDDVASHLGISKKTLYEHFRDKKDLVEHVLMYDHQSSCDFIGQIERRELNAVEEMFELYRMLNNIFRDYNPSMDYDIRKYYPDLFARIKSIRRKRMYESVVANLTKGRQEGLYRADLNIGIIARLHVFRTENLFDNDIFTPEELASFAMFHEVFVYHIQGILSEKGRSFFEENFSKYRVSL
jgi:AcrR family transcriptional regulator